MNKVFELVGLLFLSLISFTYRVYASFHVWNLLAPKLGLLPLSGSFWNAYAAIILFQVLTFDTNVYKSKYNPDTEMSDRAFAEIVRSLLISTASWGIAYWIS